MAIDFYALRCTFLSGKHWKDDVLTLILVMKMVVFRTASNDEPKAVMVAFKPFIACKESHLFTS